MDELLGTAMEKKDSGLSHLRNLLSRVIGSNEARWLSRLEAPVSGLFVEDYVRLSPPVIFCIIDFNSGHAAYL